MIAFEKRERKFAQGDAKQLVAPVITVLLLKSYHCSNEIQ